MTTHEPYLIEALGLIPVPDRPDSERMPSLAELQRLQAKWGDVRSYRVTGGHWRAFYRPGSAPIKPSPLLAS